MVVLRLRRADKPARLPAAMDMTNDAEHRHLCSQLRLHWVRIVRAGRLSPGNRGRHFQHQRERVGAGNPNLSYRAKLGIESPAFIDDSGASALERVLQISRKGLSLGIGELTGHRGVRRRSWTRRDARRQVELLSERTTCEFGKIRSLREEVDDPNLSLNRAILQLHEQREERKSIQYRGRQQLR